MQTIIEDQTNPFGAIGSGTEPHTEVLRRPKTRFVGWPFGAGGFIGYTKKSLPGLDALDKFSAVEFEGLQGTGGLPVPVKTECFDKPGQAKDAAMLWYCRKEGLALPPESGVAEGAKEWKVLIRRKFRVLNHRHVLKVRTSFPTESVPAESYVPVADEALVMEGDGRYLNSDDSTEDRANVSTETRHGIFRRLIEWFGAFPMRVRATTRALIKAM